MREIHTIVEFDAYLSEHRNLAGWWCRKGWSDDGRRGFDTAHLDELVGNAQRIDGEIDEIARVVSALEAQLDRFRSSS